MRFPRRLVAGCAAGLVALLAAGCSSDDGPTDDASSGAETSSEPADFSERGPYDAGVTTLSLPDRDVEVWYPVDPGSVEGSEPAVFYIRDHVPAAFDALIPPDVNPPYVSNAYRDAPPSDEGPFPLVLFSHGFGGFPTTSTELTDHWASWGFVVAAPDHVERGLESQLGGDVGSDKSDGEVLRETTDALEAASADDGDPLAGTVSAEEIAVVGHSAGGGAAIAFGDEPDVATYVALASASVERAGRGPGVEPPDTPSLFVAGADDDVVDPELTRETYERAPAPSRLIVIDGVGHNNAFTDICEIGGDDGGGVVGLALDLGIPVPERLAELGADGCEPEALDSELAWPVVNHFVVAQLREAFGQEDPGTGFEADVERRYEGVSLERSEKTS